MKEEELAEVTKLLEHLGAAPGVWKDVAAHESPPPLMGKQIDAVLKLKGLLENALAQDQATLVRLREQLTRITRGGGS